MKRLRILVWHVHGSYLNTLVQGQHEYYLPVRPERTDGYGGRGPTFRWPEQAIEVPAEDVRRLKLDLVLHQSPATYLADQYELLTPEQRRLPRIYLEHNTPREHPYATRHPVADDPETLLVHVTHFNRLMWDNGRAPTVVIEHGVLPRPHLRYRGDLARGIVAINSFRRRGRLCGFDVFERVRADVPLDLCGIDAEEIGGSNLPQEELLERATRYRFLFSPIRWTSLPLALVEAMAIGLPVVALATTEVPSVIDDGWSGYVSCDLDRLVSDMRRLLADRAEAERLGANARRVAVERFNLERFLRDWDAAYRAAGAG